MNGLAPGRDHDMRMLEQRLRNATSTRERELIRSKMDFIVRESKDHFRKQKRHELLQAARNGDNEAGERISEELYNYQVREGIKHG